MRDPVKISDNSFISFISVSSKENFAVASSYSDEHVIPYSMKQNPSRKHVSLFNHSKNSLHFTEH
jgi:hypothetical protein